MQASTQAARPNRFFAYMGALAVMGVVALSLPACSSDNENGPRADTNGTDPSCRPSTCTTLRKNCGLVSDGCGGNIRCGTCAGTNNDCRDNVCERACTNNNECADGSSCINGSCSDKCTDSRDCGSGQSCVRGFCNMSSAPACHYDSECRADERCTNGVCLGNNSGLSCRYDSECRGGERCSNGTCSGFGGRTCRLPSDCSSRENCINGYCSSQDGTSCNSDSQCRYDEHCRYGICRRDDGRGRVRAECMRRGISVSLPFGSVNFFYENWFYDSQYSGGSRAESCRCEGNNLVVDLGSTERVVNCSFCADTGEGNRSCYE